MDVDEVRDTRFDRAYWTDALATRRARFTRHRRRAHKDLSTIVDAVGPLAAAGGAVDDKREELLALYSSGADLRAAPRVLTELLEAVEWERQLTPLVVSAAERLDVGVQRRAYDTALAVCSWAVLLGQDAPPLALWDRADEDRLLTALCRRDAAAGRSLGTFWPDHTSTLIAALDSREAGAHVREHLATWMATSRKSAWWGSLEEARRRPEEHAYVGYWSVEAAAVVTLLGIDDSPFKDAPYYPAGLVQGPLTG